MKSKLFVLILVMSLIIASLPSFVFATAYPTQSGWYQWYGSITPVASLSTALTQDPDGIYYAYYFDQPSGLAYEYDFEKRNGSWGVYSIYIGSWNHFSTWAYQYKSEPGIDVPFFDIAAQLNGTAISFVGAIDGNWEFSDMDLPNIKMPANIILYNEDSNPTDGLDYVVAANPSTSINFSYSKSSLRIRNMLNRPFAGIFTETDAYISESDNLPDSSASTINTKIELLTLNNSRGSAQTDDLSSLVSIPEQWMNLTTDKVEVWLDSKIVNPKTGTGSSNDYAFLSKSSQYLESINSTLMSTYQVDLMQRVTNKDGTVTEAKVSQDAIRGDFTLRLPIPANLAGVKNLGIIYIEDGTGRIAKLASKIVTLDGIKYIEFANNRSALYGFVSNSTPGGNNSDSSIPDLPATGENDAMMVWGMILLGLSMIFLGLWRKRLAA